MENPFRKSDTFVLIKMYIVISINIFVCYTYYSFFLLVAYRVYNYSIFAATSGGEGPSADGSFLTREDSELINNVNTQTIPSHCPFKCLA